nr:hypothetical protein [Tanacetum cinerariifolium]
MINDSISYGKGRASKIGQELDQEDMIDINPNIDRETNTSKNDDCKDLENFREEKIELILDTVLDKLDDGWFSGTVKDEEDLDRIVDYLDLKSHDGFIDIDDKAYHERIVLEIEEKPRTSTNVAAVRAELMKEMDTIGSLQREA